MRVETPHVAALLVRGSLYLLLSHTYCYLYPRWPGLEERAGTGREGGTGARTECGERRERRREKRHQGRERTERKLRVEEEEEKEESCLCAADRSNRSITRGHLLFS